MVKLIRLCTIDGEIVWANPHHIINVKAYFISGHGIPPSPCGTAIWFTDGSKVLMTQTPDILAKIILEQANALKEED